MPERFVFDMQVRQNPPMALAVEGFFVTKERMSQLDKPVREVIDKVFIPEIAETFNQEGRPPWAQLSEKTPPQRKARTGEAHPILRDTDALYNAVLDPTTWAVESQSHNGWVGGVDEDALSQRAPYWVFHPGGTKYMPARDFFVTGREVEEAIDEIFSDFINEAIDAGIGSVR